MRRLLAIIAIMLAALTPALAEEEHHGPADEVENAGTHDHHFRHEIALFAGGTDEHGHDIEVTLALEYAYLLTPKLGIGAILEHVGGDLRNTIFAVPVYWKPAGGLLLLAAPGVEIHDGRSGGGGHHLKAGGSEDEDATYFLFRLGVGYSFHVGERYAIVPQLNLDLVNGESVWVWGVAFGVMF